MPTYDYECDSCGHRFEHFQSMTAAPIRKCPRCKKAKVRRLIGAGAGIIFKGSGFYQTDNRSESYKQGAQKDKPAASAAPVAASAAKDTPAKKTSDSASGGATTKKKD